MMAVDIGLFLDRTSEEEVRKAWRLLRTRGISSPLLRTGGKPHLTLGLWEELDTETILPRISALADELAAFPVSFASIATFGPDSGTIFLGPVITPSLIRVHNLLYRILGEISQTSEGYYRPGCWVPHCSLTLGLDRSEMQRAMDICMETVALPLRGWVREMGLITFDKTEARSFRSYSFRSP